MDGVILAGGESQRMGRPKPFVELEGRPLIAWVLTALQSVCEEVLIVASPVEAFGVFGCRVVQDLLPGQGPMGGVYTGLSSTKADRVFVAGCDTPFLNPAVIRYLASQVGDHEAVVPQISGQLHPLQAVYTRGCLPRLHKYLTMGRLSLMDFLKEGRVRTVSGDEIASLDPEQRSFLNMNTPEDLERAKTLLQGRKK